MNIGESCRRFVPGPLLFAVLLATLTPAAAAGDLDVTMRMVEDSEDLTDAVTREIRLPELPGNDNGKAAARPEATGRDVSKAARDRGRDFGQSASERAREVRDKKPERATDRLPEAAREARERKPDMPSQSSRP